MKGKTILMYLADGETTGLFVADMRNWTGKAGRAAFSARLSRIAYRLPMR